MPKNRIFSLLRLHVCTLSLSMNKAIRSNGFRNLIRCRYSMNLSVLTLLSNCITSSMPFSFDMPASTAMVDFENYLRSTIRGLFFKLYSCVGMVVRVTHISSMKMMRYPSYSSFLISASANIACSRNSICFCALMIFVFLIFFLRMPCSRYNLRR